MKRTGPPTRKTQIKRDGPGARRFARSRSTLERTAMRPAPRAEPSELAAAKAQVRKRSGGMCEASTPACPVWPHEAVHVHHVVRRPHTGGVHDPAVMLDCCRPAHDHIHANPAESYERGWLIRGV